MITVVGVITSGPNGAPNVDKDTYECVVEVPEYGKVKGKATRIENEPKVGDEVLCFIFDDPFGNNAVFLPLKIISDNDFVGIARQGYKMEFADSGITIQGKGNSPRVKIELTGQDLKVTTGNGKIEMSTTGTLKISGFTTSIEMGGVVAPTGQGPFCGLPNCLFSGAPHSGKIVTAN